MFREEGDNVAFNLHLINRQTRTSDVHRGFEDVYHYTEPNYRVEWMPCADALVVDVLIFIWCARSTKGGVFISRATR